MSQYAHYSEITPELAPVISQLRARPAPPLDDINLVRQGFKLFFANVAKAQKDSLPQESSYTVKDYQVPVDDGEILVRSVVPTPIEGEQGIYPLFVWYHPGGFVMGDVDMSDASIRRVCVELRIAVLNVEYRLAPEFPFPTGLNDCYHALKWAADNASSLSAALDKGFIVGGASAGANLAGAVALRSSEDPFFAGRRLTGQILQMPIVVHIDAYPQEYKSELLSMEQNKDAPILSKESMVKFNNWLGAPPDHPEFSILLHHSHAKSPPAFLQMCGLDPLRDEGILYTKLLLEAGVSTRKEVYTGLPHGGHSVFPNLDVSKKFEEDFSTGLRWLLAGAKVE